MNIQERIQQFKKRSLEILKRSDVLISGVIVLGILVAINILSLQFFTRVDLTQNQIYSISEVSRETVSDLDDILRINVYFSKDLPGRYVGLKDEVNSVLDEYATYSRGKVRVENVDPETLDNPETTLTRMGIPQMRFNVVEQGSYQVTSGFMGLAVHYGQETEVIPQVESIENLEYNITTAIKKVTRKDPVRVALLESHGSLVDDGDRFEDSKERLEEVYEVSGVDLREEDIPEDVKTLVVPGAKEVFSEEDLEKLDKFVMRGGSLVLMINGVEIEEGLRGVDNETGINELLNEYDIHINNDLVLDYASGRVSFDSGMFSYHSQYPPWPEIQAENFDQDQAALAGLRGVVLPWPSSVDIKATSSDRHTVLAKTTKQAWTQQETYRLQPDSDFQPEEDEQGQFNLAVMLSGNIDSAYSEDLSTEEGRVVVIGNSNFVSDNYAARNNSVFFQNLVDSVSLDESLVQIRTKEVTDRPIPNLTGTGKNFIKYSNIFALPIAVVLIGMLKYYLRKRRAY